MSSEKLAEEMISFMYNTIGGHESAFYKVLLTGKHFTKDTIKDRDFMKNYIIMATINYLNSAYKSLILKNDSYISQCFQRMSVLNHSMICLLNILNCNILVIHGELDRSKLDTSSYDKYMASVSSQLREKCNNMKEILTNSLNHDCSGIDISTCDPTVDLFIMSQHKY